jgi:quinoprotein glucose dehydrogenase
LEQREAANGCGKKMKNREGMRIVYTAVFAGFLLLPAGRSQTDWPVFGHDAGAMRYSPLDQINTKNVKRLKLAWTFDIEAPMPANAVIPAFMRPPQVGPGEAAQAPGQPPAAAPARRPRARRSETAPLVVGDVMYLSTAYNRVLALEPETGRKIWEYESPHTPALRGIAYWPGDRSLPPQVVFGTSDGFLVSLNANTGKLVAGFGDEGMVNLRTGVNGDKFPGRFYGMSSPPAIYKNLAITGANTGEMPAHGPWGDVRAWDMRNGKPVWTFHTIPRPGEPHHEDWKDDQWQDRSGANSWGIVTVDARRGMIFLPVGTPTTDFYGGDRLGSNLYGSSLVALDAATGKVKWYFQTTHHDNWDYDPTAAPALITVKRNGKTIPAVAQITKQGLLFILNRDTGKPIFGVEERPVISDNTIPGDEPWPTQPVPLKPPPLSRNTFSPDEIATVTPEHEKYCRDLLAREGGALTGGPFAQYGPKLRVIFPSWTGGPNWGGITFDPKLGYIFLNTKHLANFNKMVKSADGTTWNRVPPDNPPVNIGDDFWDGTKHWPCQKPPWGEMIAVNANTGDIAWRVPLGSFEELDKLGVPKTGTPTTNGGSTSTAGGLVFTGVSYDGKFRAFDSRTGEELWTYYMGADSNSVPISYLGKDGKQYVAVFASAGDHKPQLPGTLFVFALSPNGQQTTTQRTNLPSALPVAGNAAPAPAAAGKNIALPGESGKAVMERMCTPCHGIENIVRSRKTAKEWGDVVDDMVSRGAQGTNAEVDQVIDYLTKSFGPNSAPPPSGTASKAAAKK